MPTVPQPEENEVPESTPDNAPIDSSPAEIRRPDAAHVDDPMGDYDPEGESPHW